MSMDITEALVLRSFLILAVVKTASSQVNGPAPSLGESTDNSGGSGPSENLYKAHGWTLWLAFGVLYPAGLLVTKYGKKSMRSTWFRFHWTIQLVGTACGTAGIAIALREFDALKDSTHAKLGLSLGVLMWIQPFLGLIRPRKGSCLRQSWYFTHWLFGTGCIILGWFNIFKGLDLYVEDWPESGTLKGFYIAFSVQVAILAFVYLFLERWQHFLKQGEPGVAVKPIPINDDTKERSKIYDTL